MSLAAIGKLERGQRQRPYRATVMLLADALSLSPADRLELEIAARRAAYPEAGAPRAAGPVVRMPVHLSSFVGRERELAKVCEMLSAHRLVTLVGPGGVGKTRLAVRAAEEVAAGSSEQFDGVWFADLAPLTDDAMVVTTLASAVGTDQCRTIETLVAYLRSQTFVLVLDNCEHPLDSVARAVAALVSGCPGARILATSRQALSLDGERIYRVPTLSCPRGDAVSAADALEFDAVRLFVERAESVDSRFELTDSIVPAVAEICQRSDGLALAIELAAARMNAFSPARIARQLGEHLSLLSDGARKTLPRHATMRSLFDWSYDLLDDRERELFRRSSIFAGGFTLDLVQALYAGDDAQAAVQSLIGSLAGKSLVQADTQMEPPRYRLLEPARQYALEKLHERGEYDGAARAHARALLALSDSFDARLELISDDEWNSCVARESDNFRAAFEWAFAERGDAALGQRLAASRTATWSGIGSGQVRAWISLALKTSSESIPRELRAQLAISAARMAVIFERDTEALDASRRALGLQQDGDLRGVAGAQYLVGVALGNAGHHVEADRALREARETARSAGAQSEYTMATTGLGTARYLVGDLDEARALISETLRRNEAAGAERSAADAAMALAEIEFASGRVESALQSSLRAAQTYRRNAILIRLAMSLCNTAAYFIALRRYPEARDSAGEALRRSRAIGSVNAALFSMQHLAAIAALEGDRGDDGMTLRRAASVLGFVDEAAIRLGKKRYFTEQQEYDNVVHALRAALGDDELAASMAAGKTWPEEHAAAEALAL